jgi:nucleotide-binding universal stress UspA family protein
MIKDIVVNLSLDPSNVVAAEFAVAVASACEAHLAGIAFAYLPIMPVTDLDGAPSELLEFQRVANEKAAQAAVAKFDERARRAGLSFESRLITASPPDAADLFGRIARRFDIAVVGQAVPHKGSTDTLIVESALFDSGRPVLVVPYIHKGGLAFDRVMMCWDGSRNAARATADAMPLLVRAKAVEVVTIAGEPAKSEELAGADIAEHLARHGCKVETKRIVAGTDVASTILSHAADTGADLIVMGGYGHSMLREFILGGATRGMLAAMTVPTLMSH